MRFPTTLLPESSRIVPTEASGLAVATNIFSWEGSNRSADGNIPTVMLVATREPDIRSRLELS